MLLGLYRMATDIGSPLLTLHLNRRAGLGKEESQRLGERSGRTSMERPEGRLLWMHAASVGESLSALPLIEAFLNDRQDLHILLTTGTVTSAKLMATRLPQRAYHQYAPLDQAGAWRRFFDHWQPDLGCLIESEIWPNLILEAERADLPLALINGRMSARSAARWRWGRPAVSRLLGSLSPFVSHVAGRMPSGFQSSARSTCACSVILRTLHRHYRRRRRRWPNLRCSLANVRSGLRQVPTLAKRSMCSLRIGRCACSIQIF